MTSQLSQQLLPQQFLSDSFVLHLSREQLHDFSPRTGEHKNKGGLNWKVLPPKQANRVHAVVQSMCFSLKLQKRGNRYICPKETGRTFRPQMPITATPESLTADALKHSLITLKDHGERTSLVVHNQ
jgi:hypothetical protein